MSAFTASTEWRKVRAAVLAASTHCYLCGKDGADSVDHVVPRARGGAPLDRANLRPAHLTCNKRKGVKLHVDPPPSRDW